MNQSRNARTQKLRNFTVQIRHTHDSERIVGTGVIISITGQIVTCAHVVRDALGAHPRDAHGGEVGVYFPQLREMPRPKLGARRYSAASRRRMTTILCFCN